MKPITFKIIAGTAAILGIVLGYLDRKFAPTYLVTSDSPAYPEWLRSFAWWIASGAAIVYFVADIVEHAQKRREGPSQKTDSEAKIERPAGRKNHNTEMAGDTDNALNSTPTRNE